MARKPYSEPTLRIKPNTVECKCNMVMGVDTTQCKPCLAKGLALRVDLDTQLTAGAGEKSTLRLGQQDCRETGCPRP
jgi:hypothetical protein